MRGFFAIWKRELFAMFVTPLAWVLSLVFLLIQGMHFTLLVEHFSSQAGSFSDQTPLSTFFGNTVLLYLVLFLLVPPITMRLFAEERRSGTIEGLMTAPVSRAAVLLAKYAAAVTTYAFMWAPTVLYVVILDRTGHVDRFVVASSYLGVMLVGSGYLALGLLMSSLTKSQFIALVLTAMVLLALFVAGMGEFVAPEGTIAHAIASYISVWAHMNDFGSGIIDSRRVAFYGTLTVVSLFLTSRVMDSWRWGSA